MSQVASGTPATCHLPLASGQLNLRAGWMKQGWEGVDEPGGKWQAAPLPLAIDELAWSRGMDELALSRGVVDEPALSWG